MYTMKFYSAIKKNEIMWFAGKWMELENIILSEESQAQKTQRSQVFPHMGKLDLKVKCIYIYIYIYTYIVREQDCVSVLSGGERGKENVRE
jgi:hypothetical protein